MNKYFPFALVFLLLSPILLAQQKDSTIHEALKNLELKADSGNLRAMYELAGLYLTGIDSLPQDTVKSIRLYRKAADRGYAPAMNFLGFKYYTGEGVSKNIDSSLYWIRKAADIGDITAAANLGYLLLDSPDFPHEPQEGVKWLTIAAEEGVKEAQWRLIEIKKDTWHSLSPDSALNLGLKYYMDKAPILGVALIEFAAEENNPKAMAILGDAYSKGLGVPYNHHKSLEYFYKAAEAGNPSAQFILAELLEIFPDALLSFSSDFSFDPKQNNPQFWYEKAKSQGVTDSDTAFKFLLSPVIIPAVTTEDKENTAL